MTKENKIDCKQCFYYENGICSEIDEKVESVKFCKSFYKKPQEPPVEWENQIKGSIRTSALNPNNPKAIIETENSLIDFIFAQIAKSRQETLKQVLDSLPKEKKEPCGAANYQMCGMCDNCRGFNSCLEEVKERLNLLVDKPS